MKLVWTKRSEIRIQAIEDFLTLEAIAQTYVRGLYDSAQRLVFNPRSGQRELLLEDLRQEYRRLVEGNYKIIYYIENEIVWIVDIWDCRQNPVMLRKGVVGTEV